MADTSKTVDHRSADILKMGRHWKLIRALMGGTHAMRKAGCEYLPRWPGEDEDAWECRLATAVLFPAYARTVSIMTGKPFSKPITYGEDIPDRIRAWCENIDLEGRNLSVFAADLYGESLAYGFCGILVDVPRNYGARTKEEEVKAGIRPYFIHVHHDAVLGWKSTLRGGTQVLTQLRLLETVEEDDGLWGTQYVDQVRVLTPGRFEVYRKVMREDANGKPVEEWEIHDEGDVLAGGVPLDYIPFVPIYGRREGFMLGSPPMLDLAYQNVLHWQSSSDQQTILHVARVPILFGKGLGEKQKITVGTGSAIKAPDQYSDLYYVEHSGKAIEAGRTSILDIEDQMRQTGAELTVIKPGNTTELQTRSDNEGSMCDLQRITQVLRDAINLALQYTAKFAGDKDGGRIEIFNDFGASSLSEASAQLVADMEAAGQITLETMLAEQKRRGVLGEAVDVEKEAEAVETLKVEAEKKAAKEAAEAAKQASEEATNAALGA